MLTSRASSIFAALLVFAYIAVQCYQFYVFAQLPAANTVEEKLMLGEHPLNRLRAALMLASFFGLLFAFTVVSAKNALDSFRASWIAFAGLAIFCVMEIALRAYELLVVMIMLPDEYRAIVCKEIVLNEYTSFQSFQFGAYFPLLLAQLIGSAILAFSVRSTPVINFLLKFAFAINALRLLARILSMFFGMTALDSITNTYYLQLVFIIYVPIGFWLLIESFQNRPK